MRFVGLAQPAQKFIQILKQRLGVGGAFGLGRKSLPTGRLDFIELKFARHFLHQMGRHGTQMIHVGVDQSMLAEQIDDAGNAA